MLRAFYATLGVKPPEVERRIEGDLKEVPCEYLMGKTPRHAMQTLGTEWRELIDRDLWTKAFLLRVKSGEFGDRLVVSDYRFKHEGVALNDAGAVIYKIDRPDAEKTDTASQHVSETEVDKIPYDMVIVNDGTLEDFRARVAGLVEEGLRVQEGAPV